MKPSQNSVWKTIPTKHIEEKGKDVIVDGTDDDEGPQLTLGMTVFSG
jgi:hypothetical protein